MTFSSKSVILNISPFCFFFNEHRASNLTFLCLTLLLCIYHLESHERHWEELLQAIFHNHNTSKFFGKQYIVYKFDVWAHFK